MLCLQEIMKDYRTEVQGTVFRTVFDNGKYYELYFHTRHDFIFLDVLSADRQLANEIEFDLRKFEEEQKELEKQQRERARNISPANVC